MRCPTEFPPPIGPFVFGLPQSTQNTHAVLLVRLLKLKLAPRPSIWKVDVLRLVTRAFRSLILSTKAFHFILDKESPPSTLLIAAFQAVYQIEKTIIVPKNTIAE